MEDVATKAGFTVGALYRHFAGKPDLLLAVVENALAGVPAFHEATTDPGHLPQLVAAYATSELETVRRLAREVHTTARRDARVRELLDDYNARVRDALSERIAALDESAPVASPRVTADLLLVIVLGLAHLDTLAPERAGRSELENAVADAVRRILGAGSFPETGE